MRYYTYCNSSEVNPKQTWRTKVTPQSTRHNAEPSIGLIFFDDAGISDDDIAMLHGPYKLAEIFGPGYYIRRRSAQTVLVSSGSAFVESPDEAAPETPAVSVQTEKGLKVVNLRERYNACTYLIKQTLGCLECPDRGIPCLTGTQGPSEYTYDRVMDAVQKCSEDIGGFKYVAPGLTTDQEFMTAVRGERFHNFTLVEERRLERQKRAEASAKTRKFKVLECGRCVIKDVCNDASHCKGRYPPQEEIQTRMMSTWLPRINDSMWAPWQLEAINQFTGVAGNKRHNKRKVVLGGLRWHRGEMRAEVRYDRRPKGCARWVNDYSELQALFDLPSKEEFARSYTSTMFSSPYLYLWFMALDWRAVSRWVKYSQSPEYIHEMRVTPDALEVNWANSRWARGFIAIHTAGEFFQSFRSLPQAVRWVSST